MTGIVDQVVEGSPFARSVTHQPAPRVILVMEETNGKS